MYIKNNQNMEWSLDNVLQLIELYRQRGCLWDTDIDDYKCKRMRNESWNEISKILGIERFEIERKMKNLMSQFSRECKRYKRAKLEGRVYRSKWFGFKKLFFLKCKNKQAIVDEFKNKSPPANLTDWSNSRDDESTINENYDNSDLPLASTSTAIHNSFESFSSSFCRPGSSTNYSSKNNDPFENCELTSDDVDQISKTSSNNNTSSATLATAVVVTDVKMSSQIHPQQQQQKKLENLNDTNEKQEDVKPERKIISQKLLLRKNLEKLKNLQNAKMMSNQIKIEKSPKLSVQKMKNLKKFKTKEIYDLALKALAAAPSSSSSNNADNKCQINDSHNFIGGDRFDNIGRNFALKLKQMDRKQQIIAEKIISDVIFYGEIEQLTVGTAHKIANVLANSRKD